ncbi:hypothetical protein PV328_000648 [Microctonus aethiopoides]|uniref:RRM domain-containing protein n=4 Tax=Microctonus aethiopoides TaxID=144406 RepID=A0AA39FVC0_9HYME|nr:hypothetical protein PV328_000648 [Microctonus aethiopoides]
MSDQDDTLLDEDLGDEEYDLGNDEEEALLADDYEIDRQNSYKGEEETDDVLDLGVTDALDDLEGDDENISYRNESVSHNQTHCYNDERIVDCHGGYYDHEEQPQHYEENIGHNEAILSTLSMSTGDLREKLQKNTNNAQRDVVVIGNGQQQQRHHPHHHHQHHLQPMEDDDGEEARERRNRFQNERTIVSPKMNNEIPDSLESVVTMEQMRPMMMRGRGRGRGIRAIRGARFPNPISGYNPRFSGRGPYDDQKPPFRPHLLEARPPLFPNGPPNNMMNSQMMYHPGNSQHLPRFQQYQGRPPAHIVPVHHFNDIPNGMRLPFNQFTRMAQGQNPRMEFRPHAPGPRFNGPPNQPQFMQPRPPLFQARPQQHVLDVRPILNNHEPIMPGGQRNLSLLGPAPHPMGPHGPNNQIRLTHPGHPRMLPQGVPSRPNGPSGLDGSIPQRFARPVLNHIANHPNVPMGARPPYENRPPFQDGLPFERRNVYDPGQQQQQQQPPLSQQQYNNQPVINQFNNNMPSVGPQQQQQPQGSAVPNVPIAPGHKILINPHFRGAPQPLADGHPQWDGTQQPMPQSQVPSEQNFVQNTTSSYQDSVGYNQKPSQEYQKTKNDDPYAYFSDVWQENKTSKPKSISPLKSYSAESNYSRDSTYREYDSKYKSSDTRDSYQEDQRYRDRSPPARSRDHSQRPRPHQSNSTYHSDTYEQRSNRTVQNSSSNRGTSKPQKRSPEPLTRSAKDLSPKRIKSSSRSFHDNSTSGESHASSRHKTTDDSDPEMREYQKKMEEQKRLREKILQEKENRRKQAAMEKQGDESRDVKTADNGQQESKTTSVAHGVMKNDAESGSQSLATTRGRIRTGNPQASEVSEKGTSGVKIMRKSAATEKNSVSLNHSEKDIIDDDGPNDTGKSRIINQQKQQQSSARRVVINAPYAQRVVTSIQKTVSNLQKNQSTVSNSSAPTTQKLQNKSLTVSKNATDNARTVVKDATGSTGPTRKVIVNSALPVNSKKLSISNSNFQRIVIQPNTKPNTIVIENLATSTSEAEIRRMCQGIGTLESILMGDKTATIVFKTHSAAAVFQKKYHRKMIDLSMINVRLLNQSVSIKRPTLL